MVREGTIYFFEAYAGFGISREMASKPFQLERKVSRHDRAIAERIDSMRELLSPPDPPKRPIGFVMPQDKNKKTLAQRKA